MAAVLKGTFTPVAADACTTVPGIEQGRLTTELCVESLTAPWTLLDLTDDWAPRMLWDSPDQPQPYRATFVALANELFGQGRDWVGARRDAHFELFGIFPSFSVIRARLTDGERHACHESIDDMPLHESSVGPAAPRSVQRAAIATAQAHLACERLLPTTTPSGVLDGATLHALALYQRRYMLPSLPELDAETCETLLTPSRELDFVTLLRALRERVVDATGLIEDGSARNDWEPILTRRIESAEYRRALRSQPLPNAAPDLIARATEAAAIALGWISAESAAAGLMSRLPRRVAVVLPAPPEYHSPRMALRVEIAPGDVALRSPLGAPRLGSPSGQRPTLTLFAETQQGEVALVRWPTTVGGWKREKLPGGGETRRHKQSPSGHFEWRDLWVAPTWFPPRSTPDHELLRALPGGGWAVDREAVGPSYRSAYGLLALSHYRSVDAGGGSTRLIDTKIRTHGSGNFRSVLRGTSHGCHRLFNHLAIRLGGFLLAHGESVRHGLVAEAYTRVLHWGGQRFALQASSRGYRYELVRPVPVVVQPGRAAPARTPKTPARALAVAPSEPAVDLLEVDPGC